MEIFRELYFRGKPESLIAFTKSIRQFATGSWKCEEPSGNWKDYLSFQYDGNLAEKAVVSIYIGDKTAAELKVGNIIPVDKTQLSISEYNSILMLFYNEVVLPYIKAGTDIEIEKPTDDGFKPEDVFSARALEKLKKFCGAANKSTRAIHPLDRERWFDFICQAADDSLVIDTRTFARFLSDGSYWGMRPTDYQPSLCSCAWDVDSANQLASEYEDLIDILRFYKESRETT